LQSKTNADKQIIQIEHNKVKIPNLQEANQLAIYQRGRGVELAVPWKNAS